MLTTWIHLQVEAAPVARSITGLGWVFLILSVGFVTILTLWCFARVLSLPPEEREEIAEDTKDFHSA